MLKRKPPKPRLKTCKYDGCGKQFVPTQHLRPYCGPLCESIARNESRSKRMAEKRSLPATVQARAEKTSKDHVQELQVVFNAFVRERDYDKPCVSCGSDSGGFLWEAGHYLSVGAHPELRFHEDNCHKQCHVCNCSHQRSLIQGIGRTIHQLYRAELDRRIGPERLAFLEGPHDPRRYTADELIALKKHYRARTRELKRAREKDVTPL